MFEKVKRFYDLGLYTAEQVQKFVEKGIITKAEYDNITNNKTEVNVDV